MRIPKTSTRIDMRVDPNKKSLLELAAFLGGYESLSEFMLEVAENRANEILKNLEQKPLSDRDRDLLIKLLDKSPEPNKALKTAFKQVNASYRQIGNQIVQQINSKLLKGLFEAAPNPFANLSEEEVMKMVRTEIKNNRRENKQNHENEES